MIEEISSTEQIENLYKEGLNAPYRKIEDGHGYYGVLIRDRFSGNLQCHICGKFYKGLAWHIALTHKLLTRDYKHKYGFAFTMPLCAVSTSAKKRIHILRQREMSKNGEKIGFKKGHKIYKTKYRGRKPLSFLNSHNICPEQVLRRYYALSDTLGKMPNLQDLQIHDQALRAVIIRRFKTFNNFKKQNAIGEIIKKPDTLSEDKVLFFLRKFKKQYGRVPRSNDFRIARNGCTNVTVLKYFGSWNRALVMAGFTEKPVAA